MSFIYLTTQEAQLRLRQDRHDGGAHTVTCRPGRHGGPDIDEADIIVTDVPLSAQHVDGRYDSANGRRPGAFRLLAADEAHLAEPVRHYNLHPQELAV